MFKHVHVTHAISFTVENFYLYVYMYMYIAHHVWYTLRDKCRCSKTGTCMYCTCVSAIKPNMHTMNAVDKKSYWLCRRTAVRADTCSIVAISLNLQEKVHPVIWSLGSLPFDCCQVLAVPRPIGKRILLDCFYIFIFLFIKLLIHVLDFYRIFNS